MNITHNARAKIHSLTDEDQAFRIHITGNINQGYHLDLFLNAKPHALDVIICEVPKIIADFNSVNYLSGASVDFDYGDNEFVIRTKV